MTDSSNESQAHSAHKDEVFGSVNQLNRLLDKLDERGLILSLAAFAEEALGELLAAFMLPTKTTGKLLNGFNAPLGTFSSRIKAAYSLGLIAQDQYEDLEHLREIRNIFAHRWQPTTFDDPKVAGHIQAITYSTFHDTFPETAVEKVRLSISSLLAEIRSATHQIPKTNKGAKLIGGHLVRGFSGQGFDEQLASLQKDLAYIDENLATATGEKRTFFKLLLRRLIYRSALLLIEAKPAGRMRELLVLQDELEARAAE